MWSSPPGAQIVGVRISRIFLFGGATGRNVVVAVGLSMLSRVLMKPTQAPEKGRISPESAYCRRHIKQERGKSHVEFSVQQDPVEERHDDYSHGTQRVRTRGDPAHAVHGADRSVQHGQRSRLAVHDQGRRHLLVEERESSRE